MTNNQDFNFSNFNNFTQNKKNSFGSNISNNTSNNSNNSNNNSLSTSFKKNSEEEKEFNFTQIQNLSIGQENQIIKKRLLCELIKSEENLQEEKTFEEIGQNIDPLIDLILNKSENKINYIQSFICNIVEINTELIKLLPSFENLKDDVFIRYIISSKQIYNLAVEIYFSINDIYNVRRFFLFVFLI